MSIYRYNGYDLSWFSSDCVAEWVATDALPTSVACAEAVAVGPEKSTSVMAIMYAVIGSIVAFVLVMIPVCFLSGCCCWGKSKCARCICCCGYDEGNICCVALEDEDENDDISFEAAPAGKALTFKPASVEETEFNGFNDA